MRKYDVVYIDCGTQEPIFYPYEISVGHISVNIVSAPNRDNSKSPCQIYQEILEQSKADFIVYMHPDVEIYDAKWLEKLDTLFDNNRCIAAGFGGATGLGSMDLYRKPYCISNMRRNNYMSNQKDAEVHGKRFIGNCQVAVLDAFLMAIEVGWLRDVGGWPIEHLTHHCLDTWLACAAARYDAQTWMTGVDCLHKGGAMSIGEAYSKAKWLQGGKVQSDHELPHKWLWDEYRDVLPIEVGNAL